MTEGIQGSPALIPVLVGEVRYYDIDTTNDGGLPDGTLTNQLVLEAKNEIGNVDAPDMVSGGLISLTGNIVKIRVAAVATGTYRITLTYTNNYGQPAKGFWRFRVT